MTNTDALFQNIRVWARRAEITVPSRDQETEERLMGKLNRMGMNVTSRRSAIMLVAGKILFDDFDYSKERAEWAGVLVAEMVYNVCHGDLAFNDLDAFADRLIEEHGSSRDQEEQLVAVAKNLIAARHAEYNRPRSLMEVIMRRARGQ